MTTIENIATKLVELFGSKELALAQCQDGSFGRFNSNFKEEKEVLLYEQGCTYQEGFTTKGWWSETSDSFSIKRETDGTLNICWAEANVEFESLYNLLGGAKKEFVNIEVKKEFGATISDGHYVTYNRAYGTGSQYYDIRVEVGSDLWVACLYNQTNLAVIGINELEFALPMYSWLRKLIPTDLGSNRTDGHSAFAWNNSFSIEKINNVIIINDGERAFTLNGKKLKSKMDIDLKAAIAKAPKNTPFVKGYNKSYGTTVTLGMYKTTLVSLFNATITVGKDTEKIKNDYSGKSKCDWRSDVNSVGFATDASKTSCIMSCWENQQEDGEPEIMWSFGGKEFVILGYKRSYVLLKELGGVIPEFLEKYASLYPTSGNSWKVIN